MYEKENFETLKRIFVLEKRKIKCKVLLNYVLLCLVFVFLSFIALRMSSLHPLVHKDSEIDSSVFKTIAMQMSEGLMPYRDTFDHKGPLLYVINYLGQLISFYRGVWLFEFGAVFFTLAMMYKIASLFLSRGYSLLVVLFAGTLIMEYLSGGNLTEEYAMPFISLALFIFLDFFKNSKISILRLICCGLCLGYVLMLRPNMIAAWFVGCIAVLIKSVKNKDKCIGKYLVFFLLGVVIAVFPFVIWLAVNNSMQDFIECYWSFNVLYCKVSFSSKISAFFYFMKKPVTIVAILASIFSCLKNRKEEISWINFLLLMFSLFFISISGCTSGADNYGMVLVPVVVSPIANFLSHILEFKENRRGIGIIVACIFLMGLISEEWIEMTKKTVDAYLYPEDMCSQEVYSICNYVEEFSTEEDKISVTGNRDIIYVKSKRLPATRYSFQWPIGVYNPQIMDDYYKQLMEEHPKIIITEQSNERMKDFASRNGYTLLTDIGDDTRLFIG